jgi:hypothetical protein
MRPRLALPAGLVALVASFAAPCPASAREVSVDPGAWRVVERDSGPDRYYSVIRDPSLPFLRAQFKAPMRTTAMGFQVPEEAREGARTLRWSWRVEAFPTGGNECDGSHADSAAAVYATWKRGLRYYALKFVWSSAAQRGATCNGKRNPFVAQDSVILESGGATDQWKQESIDLPAEYRKHFEDGKADAPVPDFVGVGLLTDGDQTRSDSAADYAGVVVGF